MSFMSRVSGGGRWFRCGYAVASQCATINTMQIPCSCETQINNTEAEVLSYNILGR